jgi:hypothetical protein
MMLIYTLLIFIAVVLFINWLLGYKTGNITLTLDDRYTDPKEYAEAIIKELEEEGKQAVYKGGRKILVDGKLYEFLIVRFQLVEFLRSRQFNNLNK